MPPTASAVLPPVALYVHIPFCVSLCPYCDFVVYAGAAARGPRNRVAAFLAALETELELRAAGVLDAARSRAPQPLETVYFGGGTPSLLPPEAIARLLDRIRARFGLTAGAEVTLEANPGPDERGDATAWRDAGVTRISLGAQSMDRGELRRLGRRHGPEDVARAVEAARAAGIGSVSLDLLYDVPDSTEERWAATLDAALALRPDHLSLYALTLDDPDAEGLTGAAGDHLPTTTGARRWRDRARPAPGRRSRRGPVPPRRGSPGRRWLARLRDQQLGAARPREPPQPRVLGAPAVRGDRPGGARLRRRHAPLERGAARRLRGGADPVRRERAAPAARGSGGDRSGDRRRRSADPRAQDGPRRARRGGGRATIRDPRRGRLETGLLERRDDRLVLTTEGRLLSNELFARLV